MAARRDGAGIKCIKRLMGGAVSLSSVTAERDGAARPSRRDFLHFWPRPCDPDLWPIDPIFIGGRGIEVNYLCAKFGHFIFSRFGFIARTESQTVSLTEADDRYTHATTVGVIN